MKNLLLQIFLLCCFFIADANATSVNHDLKIEIGTFDAIDCNFSYQIDENYYSADTTLTTSGLFSALYYFYGKYSSSGKISGNKIITQKYIQIAKSRFNTRRKELVFDNNGHVTQRISTKNKEKKSVPVEKISKDYLADLQSVFISLIKQIQKTSSCSANYRVFNGKKFFDVTIKDLGQEIIKREKSSENAIKCLVFIEDLGKKEDNLMFDTTSNQSIIFWVVQDKKSLLPYLVKAELAQSPLGKISAYAENIDIKE